MWHESRGTLRSGRAARAREHGSKWIGQWFFRCLGGGEVVVGVVVAVSQDRIELRGNGRTRRLSWETFANEWQPWQGDAMPRPTVLASGQLVWPTALPGVCAPH